MSDMPSKITLAFKQGHGVGSDGKARRPGSGATARNTVDQVLDTDDRAIAIDVLDVAIDDVCLPMKSAMNADAGAS